MKWNVKNIEYSDQTVITETNSFVSDLFLHCSTEVEDGKCSLTDHKCNGGAIFAFSNTSPELDRCFNSLNPFTIAKELFVSRCSFQQCKASGRGGAIFVKGFGKVQIMFSVFNACQACCGEGGAISLNSVHDGSVLGHVELKQCSSFDNSGCCIQFSSCQGVLMNECNLTDSFIPIQMEDCIQQLFHLDDAYQNDEVHLVCKWSGSLVLFESSEGIVHSTSITNSPVGGLEARDSVISLESCVFKGNNPNIEKYQSARRNVHCVDSGSLNVSGVEEGDGVGENDSLWILNEGCVLLGIASERTSPFFVPQLTSVSSVSDDSTTFLTFIGTLLFPCNLSFQIVTEVGEAELSREFKLTEFVSETEVRGSIPSFTVKSAPDEAEIKVRLVYQTASSSNVTKAVVLKPFKEPKTRNQMVVIISIACSIVFVALLLIVVVVIVVVRRKVNLANRKIEIELSAKQPAAEVNGDRCNMEVESNITSTSRPPSSALQSNDSQSNGILSSAEEINRVSSAGSASSLPSAILSELTGSEHGAASTPDSVKGDLKKLNLFNSKSDLGPHLLLPKGSECFPDYQNDNHLLSHSQSCQSQSSFHPIVKPSPYPPLGEEDSISDEPSQLSSLPSSPFFPSSMVFPSLAPESSHPQQSSSSSSSSSAASSSIIASDSFTSTQTPSLSPCTPTSLRSLQHSSRMSLLSLDADLSSPPSENISADYLPSLSDGITFIAPKRQKSAPSTVTSTRNPVNLSVTVPTPLNLSNLSSQYCNPSSSPFSVTSSGHSSSAIIYSSTSPTLLACTSPLPATLSPRASPSVSVSSTASFSSLSNHSPSISSFSATSLSSHSRTSHIHQLSGMSGASGLSSLSLSLSTSFHSFDSRRSSAASSKLSKPSMAEGSSLGSDLFAPVTISDFNIYISQPSDQELSTELQPISLDQSTFKT
ncbi:uncharacterized protein MONOS_11198 [Monocercomonoides exilis]|uniref:uncharacterized protein n=1 Tax=Monocercomonoides exilis TaxID=2049356 RepID=UPI00355990FB|nr:hypothetical protein MONOS_11198 [Monocercomonoides exilis]|eukprot:MONOS_11198.1-p1 / transcript=MONOS_11198.1 / gene=MONOS_11198 / organism=Monocercomonoides_exilis_PA203 / gene_product=unspecified product / transcript_product=unspecified product / location=Mono_scaffold00549:12923-15718(-) / protein_length=932 / sequence_SO=supercontig / SO=protein_coding / is_pseudo=false